MDIDSELGYNRILDPNKTLGSSLYVDTTMVAAWAQIPPWSQVIAWAIHISMVPRVNRDLEHLSIVR